MVLILKKTQLGVGLLGIALCLLLGAAAFWYLPHHAVRSAFAGGTDAQRVLILDAGHGGEDGGAVSADGVAESRINLEIVRRLDGLFAFLGQRTLLTREGEGAIYSPDAQTLREKKVSDLQNRVKLVNGITGGILLSVHQNSLPANPTVHGAQAFFNKVSPADQIAAAIQSALNGTANDGGAKSAKQMERSIYLLEKVNCPGVLVECGFLSNSEETRQLQTASYQVKLAQAIACGYLQYLQSEADNREG